MIGPDEHPTDVRGHKSDKCDHSSEAGDRCGDQRSEKQNSNSNSPWSRPKTLGNLIPLDGYGIQPPTPHQQQRDTEQDDSESDVGLFSSRPAK